MGWWQGGDWAQVGLNPTGLFQRNNELSQKGKTLWLLRNPKFPESLQAMDSQSWAGCAVAARAQLQVPRREFWCCFLSDGEPLLAGPRWGLGNGSPLPQARQRHHIPAGDQLWRPGPPRARRQRGQRGPGPRGPRQPRGQDRQGEHHHHPTWEICFVPCWVSLFSEGKNCCFCSDNKSRFKPVVSREGNRQNKSLFC